MSEYYVAFHKMNTCAAEMKQIRRDLSRVAGEIQNVANSSALSSMKYVTRPINTQLGKVQQAGIHADQLAGAITRIGQLYRNCENEIAGKGGSRSDIQFIQCGLLPGIDKTTKKIDIFSTKDLFQEIKGSVFSGELSAETLVAGLVTTGAVSGSLFGGSIKTKGKAKWDPDEGDLNAELSVKAEGYAAEGKAEGRFGLLGGEVSGKAGDIAASGAIGASLIQNKKLSPELYAKAKAEAAAVKGEAEAKLGTDENNIHTKASGKLLEAEAEAKAGAGKITKTDEDGNTKTAYGVEAKAGAEAYLASGEISGGFSVFGIKIDGSVEGKAGGAGATAEAALTTGGVRGELGLGVIAGLDVAIEVDWSEFSPWWENTPWNKYGVWAFGGGVW